MKVIIVGEPNSSYKLTKLMLTKCIVVLSGSATIVSEAELTKQHFQQQTDEMKSEQQKQSEMMKQILTQLEEQHRIIAGIEDTVKRYGPTGFDREKQTA